MEGKVTERKVSFQSRTLQWSTTTAGRAEGSSWSGTGDRRGKTLIKGPEDAEAAARVSLTLPRCEHCCSAMHRETGFSVIHGL